MKLINSEKPVAPSYPTPGSQKASARLTRPVIATLTFVLSTTAGFAANSIIEAFNEGKVSLNVRPRYEFVEQTGVQDANAFTVGTHLGFTTGAYHGFSASLEAGNVTAIDGDSYNQAGLNPGGADKAVVADPVGTEINQVWLKYKGEGFAVVLGRQKLILDNARFVGNVGWRQNMQTFDAITITSDAVEKLKLTYSYLNRINRVFGDDHPAGVWKSDSHVFNAGYSGLPVGTITGYAYLLDFDNAAANSAATYGISFAGNQPIDENKVTYRAEFATQSDYGNAPVDFSTEYYNIEAGFATKPVTVGIGYEVLGSDSGQSFRTPLATLHSFNGWADRFLTTPADGLRDIYGSVTVPLPYDISTSAIYHQFDTDLGDELGKEIDLVATMKFTDNLSGLIKFADFKSDNVSQPDVTKFWVQGVFNY